MAVADIAAAVVAVGAVTVAAAAVTGEGRHTPLTDVAAEGVATDAVAAVEGGHAPSAPYNESTAAYPPYNPQYEMHTYR